MLGLVIRNEEQSFIKVLIKHFDDLVSRGAMQKIRENVYEIDFLGSILAYEQRRPTELEIRKTIESVNFEIDTSKIDEMCIILAGDVKLLSTAYIHYEGLIREGIILKNKNAQYEITQLGINEMIKMFRILGK